MIYVALLRGINVGGNNKVIMSELKDVFESLGFKHVKTYINSGNILFGEKETPDTRLASLIEQAINDRFGLIINVIVKNLNDIRAIAQVVPDQWLNNSETKTDVMFLWQPIDNSEILNELGLQKNIENFLYIKGAVVWNIDRKNFNKSKVVKMVGTPIYKQMTIRNINTLRKIKQLMEEQLINDH